MAQILHYSTNGLKCNILGRMSCQTYPSYLGTPEHGDHSYRFTLPIQIKVRELLIIGKIASMKTIGLILLTTVPPYRRG